MKKEWKALGLVNGVIRNTLEKFVMYFLDGQQISTMLWMENEAKSTAPCRAKLNWIDGDVKAATKSVRKVFESIVRRKQKKRQQQQRYSVVNIIMTSIIILSIFMSDRLVLAMAHQPLWDMGKNYLS